MSVHVVDASVATKWYVPEIHEDLASKLLDEDRSCTGDVRAAPTRR